MKKKILFSLLASLILPCMVTAKSEKTSVKSIVCFVDEFAGKRTYQSPDLKACRFEGFFLLQLGVNLIPRFVIENDVCSITLEIDYHIGTVDDEVFEKIIFIGNGNKAVVDIDTSKMTYSKVRLKNVEGHGHKCFGTISKEEYDILKSVFENCGDAKFSAYSSMNKTLQGDVKGKKHMTLFSDLETATLADNPDVTFAKGDGVIKISAQ